MSTLQMETHVLRVRLQDRVVRDYGVRPTGQERCCDRAPAQCGQRRCSRLKAVREKAGTLVESVPSSEQPLKLSNIFKRAVRALRPSHTDVQLQEKEANLHEPDSDTPPSSTGRWPSTFQYLLPRIPFFHGQGRSAIVPTAGSLPLSSPASESPPPATAVDGTGGPAEPGSSPLANPAAAAPQVVFSNSSQVSLSPTVMPFVSTANPPSGPASGNDLTGRRKTRVDETPSEELGAASSGSGSSESAAGAAASQQESILRDSSSRWLEDGASQADGRLGEASGSSRDVDGRESPKLLFFWRNRQAKQHRPEPELRPLQASHPSLQLVRERAGTGSRPGHRTDGHKLGLVIEGGGMRGAVSGGALQALHDLGLRDVFDVAYGSSAGAINATYFLSGQREGVDVYSQDISNKTFCDLRRLLDRKRDINEDPVLNLTFLLDHVMENLKPLDWEAVIRSPIPLKVVASCLDTLQPVILSDFTSKADLKRCLQCSANVPNIAGSPIEHRGMTLVDAAVFEPVPFRAAIADGCSHIVVLATRPPFRGGRLRKAVADVFTRAVKHAVLNPDYMNQAWARELEMLAEDGLTSDEMLLLGLENGSEKMPFFSGCHVYPVFPGEGASYAPVCTDVPVLRAGIQEGIDCIRRVFQPYDASSPFPPYRPAKGLFPDEEAAATDH